MGSKTTRLDPIDFHCMGLNMRSAEGRQMTEFPFFGLTVPLNERLITSRKSFRGITSLSPVHTKHDNYKVNDKDNDISIHTGERYRLFILSARTSTTLNSRAPYSRMDSDWMSMFVSFISWKKNRSESDSNDIVSLCLYHYSCGVVSAIL